VTNTVMSTGNGELDNKMGGGIPVGSLTMIEGSSGSGKSVLAQQITWGSLKEGFTLAMFSSENTVKSLVQQMQSLDLDVLDFLLLGRLRIYPMEPAQLGAQAAAALLQAIRQTSGCEAVIVDSLTSVIAALPSQASLRFLEECKRLCASGKTILLVIHDQVVADDVLVRMRSMCDADLRLRSADDGKRMLKMLEVTKVRGGGSTTGAIVSFDVEPGWGMRVVPINKVKG
jgi:flagellar protein FlaH